MTDSLRWRALAEFLTAFGQPAVVIDLETTGGNPDSDRVTEIALLRFDDGGVTRYTHLVNPQRGIPAFIAALTGIDDGMVAGAPPFAALAGELLPLLRGCVLLAHNSKFDYTFLRREFARCGLHFAVPTLCTVQLSRRLYPQFFKHSLESIIERHGIAAAPRHRAMSDVLALADYLETAAADLGRETLAQQAGKLLRPRLPPAGLSDALERQLDALSDGHGVLLWLDASGKPLHLAAHRQTFSEASELLHKQKPLRAAAEIRFLPAAGALHALMLKAQTAAEYGFRPSENAADQEYLTVRLRSNERGHLQARLVRLSDGLSAEKPNGLFLHKKAAKRALDTWAREQGLCPALLDILPPTFAKNAPCPVAACGGCGGECASSDGLNAHNRKTADAAALLPVADWGKAHTLEITETDEALGSLSFSCSGGALLMPDGLWYFDRSLPAVLKEKLRKERHTVKVLA